MTDIIEELTWRGLIAQCTDIAELKRSLAAGPVTYYCGFDPTAPSLHHGHLVQLILLRHLQRAGHRAIALVGGATGLIGDPRMSGERVLNDKETVALWVERLRAQISRFLDFDGDNPARMVNNLEWTSELTAIDFLRDVGKHYRLGTMLAKDTVARRLASDEGISFTEFSYQILQGYDYLQLHERFGCSLQTGGNDQWGNLLSGVELIRKSSRASVHALTTPLITKADGTKFGKSEGGAVWLDAAMMSPYAFYQFWLNVEDADVERFLKIFTFRSPAEIADLVAQSQAAPHLRVGQRALAGDVTTLVHGPAATQAAIDAAAALFGQGDLSQLDEGTLAACAAEMRLSRGAEGAADGAAEPLQPGQSGLPHALVQAGVVRSISEARRAIADGGAYVNNQRIADISYEITGKDALAGGWIVLRRGKKNVGLVRLTETAE